MVRKNKEYKPITRNRDENGRILTYSVKMEEIAKGYEMEFNTLKKARLMALKIK